VHTEANGEVFESGGGERTVCVDDGIEEEQEMSAALERTEQGTLVLWWDGGLRPDQGDDVAIAKRQVGTRHIEGSPVALHVPRVEASSQLQQTIVGPVVQALLAMARHEAERQSLGRLDAQDGIAQSAFDAGASLPLRIDSVKLRGGNEPTASGLAYQQRCLERPALVRQVLACTFLLLGQSEVLGRVPVWVDEASGETR
jgi:hypothetical protein